MIKYQKGNIFTSTCDTVVNAVNCSGVMGAGIALEFRLRYPEMFAKYEQYCESKHMAVGKLWNFKDVHSTYGFKSVLSFPTKTSWKNPSDLRFIELGLQNFATTYKKRGITSVAFPMLGVGKGGLAVTAVSALMEKYLSHLPDLIVEIWEFDPVASDDLYGYLEHAFNAFEDSELIKTLDIKPSIFSKIKEAVAHPDINSISAIASQRGIGEATVNKLIRFCSKKPELQPSLL
ncbi:macro domain-containing protein [Paraferrimonas haliotis]|uniref:macro domain-containing protein n=1 Tax=Paraferrimonas haliotis TaxID=2013866 RepID=UPI000BA9661B|nr:macro domain-containing protein [Paraferrimonas haliotis]